jgi:phage protein D
VPEAVLQPSELWRAPRLQVLANGAPLPGVIEASVISTGYFTADFFHVRAALAGSAAAWAASASVAIDVQMALGALGSFVSVVQGMADAVSIDPIAGTLSLEGRSYAAQLIEARTLETFANRTSGEIATILAARHNLTANVQPTTTPVGRYWELEHDALTLSAGARATTEWDLLTTLAGWEGFDLWVAGTTLNFVPPDTATPPVLLSAAPTAAGLPDFTALRLDHALSFAGDIIVSVQSWHSRMGAGTMQTARTERGAATAQEYAYVVPNLTPDAALLLAQRRLAELSAHELVLRAEMPGELSLTPGRFFQLVGTGTAFDCVWRITELERRMSVRDGFRQWLRANAAAG